MGILQRLKMGAVLTKDSVSVMRHNPSLFLFPFVSGITGLLFLGVFIGTTSGLTSTDPEGVSPNSIKQEALRVRATNVAFENLTRIRNRISNLPKFQQWLFKKVRKYTAYKLERYGVSVDTTKPAYTSQGCSRTDCDCVDEDNREGKHLECLECDYTVNSDYNAAKNIGFRYLSKELSSPAGRTCSSGQATSQLALLSGTLSPTGEFAEHEWVSTDKPHRSNFQ